MTITAQLPSGLKLQFPDGTDPAVVDRAVKEALAPPAASWADLPGNILPSAGRFVGGVANAVVHPIDTASGLLNFGAGALRNIAPASVRNAIDSVDTTPEAKQAAQRASNSASAVGSFYKDRYGGLANLKQSVITDPVGVAADASAVLGLGGMTANALNLTRTGNALNTASIATNPLTAVAAVGKPLLKGVGSVAKNVLGMTSGVGPENVSQAVAAGFKGPRQGNAFMDNLTSKANPTDVLDIAKEGIENMGRAKAAEYRANMAAVSGDKTVLGFSGIDNALNDANAVVSFKGQVTNDKAAAALKAVSNDVQSWKNLDPAQFHTPEGLDALKQKIGGILEAVDPVKEKTARLAVGKVYNAVKSEIAQQAPVYANTMKSYSEASELIREIEGALSLGRKAMADTAMRKLQSLSRNNASTNYGNRLSLANELERGGGVEILPAIAGQAMNTWTPRGLTGQLGGMATMGTALMANPLMATALPFQSPKALGLMSYGAGRTAGVLSRGAEKMNMTPTKANALLLTAAELDRLRQQ